jgi:hypothetical protein
MLQGVKDVRSQWFPPLVEPLAHAHGRECAIAIFKMMLQPSGARCQEAKLTASA